MANNEVGTFTFESNVMQKTVNLQESYTNQIVVKLTPTKNISVYLTDVQNSYFIVEKNTNEELEVNYIVIESES
jgi:hypothetical protein